jgi:asparaginyl-tRNA synthetase
MSASHDETHSAGAAGGPAGPVVAALRRRLVGAGFGAVEVGLAERSPFGGAALRVRVPAPRGLGAGGGDLDALAAWLAAAPEVDGTAVRPPQVYVRLTTAALHRWATASTGGPAEGSKDGAGGPAGRSRWGAGPVEGSRDDAGRTERSKDRAGGTAERSKDRAGGAERSKDRAGGGGERDDRLVIRAAPGGPAPTGSLLAFRQGAVATALARLHEHHGGATLVIDDEAPEPPGAAGGPRAGGPADVGGWAGAAELVVGGPGGLAVGAVEVPHGPLRTRHGGAVDAGDLLAELARVPAPPHGTGAGGRPAGADPGHALLTFVMLRPRRTRRLRLDDERLAGEGDALSVVRAAGRAAAAASVSVTGVAAAADPDGGVRPGRDAAVQTLAIELERVPGTIAHARRTADPSFVVAALRSLAGAVTAVAGQLPPGDPLWPVAADALDTLALLSGVTAPDDPPDPNPSLPNRRTAVMTLAPSPSPRTGALPPTAVYAWTGDVLASLRTALDEHGFTEILPVILSERFEPGARHSVAVLGDRALPGVEQSDRGVTVTGDRHYHLPVSHCVEKQLALEHASRVYCLAPCVRLLMDGEDTTGRHLYTFFQAEIEWHTESVDEVHGTIESVLGTFAQELLGRLEGTPRLDEPTARRIKALADAPYEKLPFGRARERVAGVGGRPNPHATGDLTHGEEAVLSHAAVAPFWLTDYPDGVRDSLYRRTADGTFATYDLILPGGHGELATGGLRPDSSEDALRQASSFTDRAHPYYAEWKARTNIQTGGIGFGVERLIRYCSGAESVLDLRSAHDHGPNATIGA